jgi:hypothetical protein
VLPGIDEHVEKAVNLGSCKSSADVCLVSLSVLLVLRSERERAGVVVHVVSEARPKGSNTITCKQTLLPHYAFHRVQYVLSVEGRVRALHDHRHTGFLQLDEFWAGVHEKRSVYTDAILEVLGTLEYHTFH